ncbi:MAG: DNA topoisomerase IB [Acidimicrobiia bacterium]
MALDEAAEAASEAGLLYVTDEAPGIRRVRRGRGFSYLRPDGVIVQDERERARIKEIAIPPAWTEVWICPRPDGHILATGRDARGRKQYCYHPKWRESRDGTKFHRLRTFGELLPDLRASLERDLLRPGLPPEKVLALVVRLLDETLIRVGNPEYATANETYGLTTLGAEHVEVSSSRVVFDFNGKGGAPRQVALPDRRLARLVKECHELGGRELFTYEDEAGARSAVGSENVNDYLRALTGEDFSSKDFRTWGGTSVATEALGGMGAADDEDQAESNILSAIDQAAEKLGNTREVCRDSYVHPAVPEAYRDGRLIARWKSTRAGQRMGRNERTVLAILPAKRPGRRSGRAPGR